ncbi:MAG TPA: phosphotransferase [Candidatus Limnocylindrales bacterium]|nr:phosphotransferase [Candidatus Limnocylindrales bacterium]
MTEVGRRRWTDPTWLAGFSRWATGQLDALGYRLTDAPSQDHVRPWSTVLRLPTDRGPVWAKAMRASTAHEARLLPAMVGWGVRAVIPPLAVDARRGWLLLEDGGPTLRQTRPDGTGDRDLAAWERVLATYAELQRSVEMRNEELMRIGVPDGRPATLVPTMHALLADDRWWGLVGPEDRAASDAARERLGTLGAEIAARATDLDASGIAPTIQHDDLHGGNVFVGPAGIRFFDWGDSVVAHPFASMVTTLNSVAHRLETTPDDPRLDRLRDAYLEAWTDVLPRPALHEVLALALVLGRIGKAAAWARALGGLEPAEMEAHADAPALWLADLAELVDAGGGR